MGYGGAGGGGHGNDGGGGRDGNAFDGGGQPESGGRDASDANADNGENDLVSDAGDVGAPDGPSDPPPEAGEAGAPDGPSDPPSEVGEAGVSDATDAGVDVSLDASPATSDARAGGACIPRGDASVSPTEKLVFANSGPVLIDSSTPLLVNVPDFVLADVTGDSVPDLVLAATYGNQGPQVGKVQVSRGRGDGTFDAPQVIWTGALVIKLLVVDVNDDGRFDVVVLEEDDSGLGNAMLHVLTGDETGHFSEQGLASHEMNIRSSDEPLLAGDLNGDGLPDLVLQSTQGILVRLNVGGSFPNECGSAL